MLIRVDVYPHDDQPPTIESAVAAAPADLPWVPSVTYYVPPPVAVPNPRLLTVGRKTGQVTLPTDKTVSREHAFFHLIQSSSSSRDESHYICGAPPSTPEQMQACRDSPDGLAVVLTTVGRCGCFWIRPRPTQDNPSRQKDQDEDDDDDATDEEGDMPPSAVLGTAGGPDPGTASQSYTAFPTPLSLATQAFWRSHHHHHHDKKSLFSVNTAADPDISADRLMMQALGPGTSVVLTDLSLPKPRPCVLQMGKSGATLILTRTVYHVGWICSEDDDDDHHEAVDQLLARYEQEYGRPAWSVGLASVQTLPPDDPPPPHQDHDHVEKPRPTHLVTSTYRPHDHQQLLAWYQGIPLVHPEWIRALFQWSSSSSSSPSPSGSVPWPRPPDYPPAVPDSQPATSAQKKKKTSKRGRSSSKASPDKGAPMVEWWRHTPNRKLWTHYTLVVTPQDDPALVQLMSLAGLQTWSPPVPGMVDGGHHTTSKVKDQEMAAEWIRQVRQQQASQSSTGGTLWIGLVDDSTTTTNRRRSVPSTPRLWNEQSGLSMVRYSTVWDALIQQLPVLQDRQGHPLSPPVATSQEAAGIGHDDEPTKLANPNSSINQDHQESEAGREKRGESGNDDRQQQAAAQGSASQLSLPHLPKPPSAAPDRPVAVEKLPVETEKPFHVPGPIGAEGRQSRKRVAGLGENEENQAPRTEKVRPEAKPLEGWIQAVPKGPQRKAYLKSVEEIREATGLEDLGRVAETEICAGLIVRQSSSLEPPRAFPAPQAGPNFKAFCKNSIPPVATQSQLRLRAVLPSIEAQELQRAQKERQDLDEQQRQADDLFRDPVRAINRYKSPRVKMSH